MTLLNYKGYQATVTYEEGNLIIHVLHVDDFLTAQCDSAFDAQTVFEELINEYLEDCKQLGVAPNKPYKGSFNVRIPPESHKAAATAAAEANLTLNSWVSEAIAEKAARKDFGKNVIRENFERILADRNVIGGVTWSKGNWKFISDYEGDIPKDEKLAQILTMIPVSSFGGNQVN